MCDTALLKQQARDDLWTAFQPPIPFESIGEPSSILEASGCTMIDSEGKHYLDGLGALEACVAGHCREELANAAIAQKQKPEFLYVFRFASPPATQLVSKLAAIASGVLKRMLADWAWCVAWSFTLKMTLRKLATTFEPFVVTLASSPAQFTPAMFFFRRSPVINHVDLEQLVSIVDRALTLVEEGT
ncbi:MAG: aminotransferase class III-fold pyridoxal phosphate-dependent enzyme [Chloroflexi bacterium]|nr:aminotransferase class III-fold pyridoxal phosphate-dependent enzyme [Chloroflexota bacterium]